MLKSIHAHGKKWRSKSKKKKKKESVTIETRGKQINAVNLCKIVTKNSSVFMVVCRQCPNDI